MYIFVAVQERELYYREGPAAKAKVRIEEASGERCLIFPYQEFDMAAVAELQPRAVVMSGFGGHFESRKVEWFYGMDEVMHRADLPILCICGSHQLLGFSFTRDLRRIRRLKDQPMRKLRRDEDLPRRPCSDPSFDISGFFHADGFYPIRQVRPDPLFRGLPSTMYLRCNHYCEVKEVPPDFVRLAGSSHCRVEAMRHKRRPLYGVQFHPENYDAPYFHGRQVLRNFAAIVRSFWS